MTAPRPIEPWKSAQAYDEPVEVAPGIIVVKIPIPIRLNHVNAYLLDDKDGWTIFDTGMNDERCIETWEKVFANVLNGRPVRRLIVSHFHLDHVGLAGWIDERFKPAFFMSQTEYLLSRLFQSGKGAERTRDQRHFLIASGLSDQTAQDVAIGRMSRVDLQKPVPSTFNRLRAGDTLEIGGRSWLVMSGGGHAVEQLMLYCERDKLFISADQVLAEISPNVSVGALAPTDDPLADFLRSFREIRAAVSDDVLVLPGHRRPFHGLHARLAELDRHHVDRCRSVLDACSKSAMTALDLVPIVFERTIEMDVLGAAIGETVAHTNYLLKQGKLMSAERNGMIYYRTAV